MKISVGEKVEIRKLFYEGEYTKAINKLAKLYNKNLEKKEDKYFILYNLSLYNMKLDKQRNEFEFKIANYYLSELYEFITPLKNNMEVEYYNTVWLDTEMNKTIYTKDILIDKYEKLLEYYKRINCKRCEIGILINIYKIQNKYDDIVNLVYEVNSYKDNDMVEMLDELLQECKTFGDTYYKKALNILNQIKIDNCITSL